MNKIRYCDYDDGYVWNFNYTGGEQTFTVPENCSGIYKLETWGAQGGMKSDFTQYENYGGHSNGLVYFDEFRNVYINVGGHGSTYNLGSIISYGGYNGGGNGGTGTQGGSGGGGATHIATKSGLLSSLFDATDYLLIVSGGGGGTAGMAAGAGGGYIGNNGGFVDSYPEYYATGATQEVGGIDAAEGVARAIFGIGGSYFNQYGGNGGGGGFYGGGGSSRSHSGGGGGSGYIGNTYLFDKAMYCYNCATSNEVSTKTVSTTCHSSNPTVNCAKEGNGYARITLVSID